MKSYGKVKDVLYKFKPTQIIVIGFFVIILIGAGLLSLPIATKSGEVVSFVNALFTSTSATCITGLVVYDTATHWSLFGQIVIITLIQIGGIGFMTIASLLSFMRGRRITLRERLIMVESLNYSEIQGIVRMYKNVLYVTFITEAAGAVILAFRFVPMLGYKGIYAAVFTAISAFCNAGFDVFGMQGTEFVSMMGYVNDPVVNLTLMALIIIGGLGFFVIANLYRARKKSDLHLHTKLVLIITAILIFSGAAAFFVFEYNNPSTIGNMSIGNKILTSFFQSVTTRTAGFATIDQKSLSSSAKLISVMLMFIGGSPGSTAGGMKTTTVGVLVLSAYSVFKGRSEVNVFGKRISPMTVRRAAAIVTVSLALMAVSLIIIASIENASVLDCMYEVASAYCTVGLSANLTPNLHTVSKLILAGLMFAGRVGSMTLAMAVAVKSGEKVSKIRYPEAKVMIG